MSQRDQAIPTRPLTAPIESPLISSTKEKRIPSQLYQSSSRDSTTNSSPSSSNNHSKDIPKHKTLPAITTTRSSNISGFKITPVSDSYRHVKSASYDEKSNDKKRLVDQFYDQLGTPPPSAPGTRIQTPTLSRMNTAASFHSSNKSRNNLVLNKYDYEPKSSEGPTTKIDEMINALEQFIVQKIKEQVEVNEDEFSEKVDDFQYINDEIQVVKNRIHFIIKEIENEKLNQFNDDFISFKQEIDKFLDFLKILENYEKKLNDSRARLSSYKGKLYDIRSSIELGEKLQISEYEKSEVRNKWIIIVIFIGVVGLAYIKLFK